MKKILSILLIIITTIILFNKKLIEAYTLYKFSNWVEKKVIFEKFKIKYPNIIIINDLKILNSDPIYYETIFEADILRVKFNLKSLFFSKLVSVYDLKIQNPKFFLELVMKEIKSDLDTAGVKIVYEDNIGLAKKINENLPEKIWPIKKKDINFLISKINIDNGKAFIKISTIPNETETAMSDIQFVNVGNEKGHKHYKDALKIVLFDIFARLKDPDLKKILKKVYNF